MIDDDDDEDLDDPDADRPPAFGTRAYYADIERKSRQEEGRAKKPKGANKPRLPSSVPTPELMSLGAMLAEAPASFDPLLEPILPRHGLALLYSRVGAGKSWLAMAIALAVASGGKLFDWRAPNPRRVLYIDNEMPRAEGIERLQRLAAGLPRPPGPDMLQAMWGFDAPEGLLKLDTEDARTQLNWLEYGAELTIVDSLSSMVSDASAVGAAWHRMQDWLNVHRRNRAVLVVHHANERGTILGGVPLSRPVDTVIALKPSPDWRPQDSVCASVRIEKARRNAGAGVRWLHARLNAEGEAATWTWAPLDEAAVRRAAAMLDEGRTAREIAADLQVSPSLAYRFMRRAIDERLCDPPRRGRFGRPPKARNDNEPAAPARRPDDEAA